MRVAQQAPRVVEVQHITNIEQARDATHGFAISEYNIALSLEPGEHANVDFVASHPGVFPVYCTEFCSALHLEMAGYFLVEPKTPGAAVPTEPAPAPGEPAPSNISPALSLIHI